MTVNTKDRAQKPTAGASADPIRVMIVDDSAIIRVLIARMLESDPDISIIASVFNGEMAVNELGRRSIDVIILDIEMPVMDGMTALPKLIEADPDIKIIMASTLTLRNAEISLLALQAGAADYLPKPSKPSEITGEGDFRRGLLEKVKSLGAARKAKSASRAASTSTVSASAPAKGARAPVTIRKPSAFRPEVLAIGSSTGGPQALMSVFGGLTSELQLPILVTQHMPPTFTTILAEHLGRLNDRPAAEGKDGEIIVPGRTYLAPGSYHMVVERQGTDKVIRLNQEDPENFCRPAVDPMLRSIAEAYGSKVLTVILTGMGCDGLKGGQDIVKAGGTVVAQDEETSVVWGMPAAVAGAGICSAVLPLADVAPYIMKFSSRVL